MLQKATFDFLKDLASNNNRDWFNIHKKRYEAAKADVEQLTRNLIGKVSRFDPLVAGLTPKDCLFRIYRDVRFSKDKSPYKTHFGVWLCPTGQNSGGPGYYLHVEPGKSFMAEGYWMPPADHLKAVRQEIDYNGSALKKTLNSRAFKKYYSGFSQEDKLKTAPQGYPKDHPDIELLRLKSFVVVYNVQDKLLTSEKAAGELSAIWKAALPVNAFLKEAVAG